MHILAVETTGQYASVAIIDENKKILAHETTMDAMNHLTGLVPMIKTALENANLEGKNLAAIACDIGPGSFTGIRIGVSTARALAQSWGIPCVAVPGLASFLYRTENSENIMCAIYNARRHQVYGMIEDFLDDGPWMIEDIIETITNKVIPAYAGSKTPLQIDFFGDGVDAYEDILVNELVPAMEEAGIKYVFTPGYARYQDAVQIAHVGLQKYLKGESCEYYELMPNYMRQAEAEQKLRAGELPICKGPKQE